MVFTAVAGWAGSQAEIAGKSRKMADRPKRERKLTEKGAQYRAEVAKSYERAETQKQTIKARLEAKFAGTADESVIRAGEAYRLLKGALLTMEESRAPLDEYAAKLLETAKAESAYIRAMKAAEKRGKTTAASAATGGGGSAVAPAHFAGAPADAEDVAISAADEELFAGITAYMSGLKMEGGYRRRTRRGHRKAHRKSRRHHRKVHRKTRRHH